MISLNLGEATAKRKKLEMKDVFSMDDDAEETNGPKKRKLVPLDYEDSTKSNATVAVPQSQAAVAAAAAAAIQASKNSTSSRKKEESSTKKSGEEAARSQEERRKHIKSIIDRIPTEKEDLFNYKLDWNETDNTLMEKKIRPWINKKIIEYIGEPEPTLVDFICSKVLAGSTPQGILDDVQMVRRIHFPEFFFN